MKSWDSRERCNAPPELREQEAALSALFEKLWWERCDKC